MDYIHIIAIWVIFVMLVAIYLVAKVLTKQQRLGNETDFISDFVDRKKNFIKKNDVNLSFTVYMIIMLLSPVLVGLIIYILTKKAILAVLLAMSSFLIPDAVLTFLKNRENKKFEEKYERSLEQLSSALKAGMSIMQAVKEVSENKFIYEPIRKRFAKLYADLTMGVTTKDAFFRFAESTDSSDAMDVALVIDVQSETGGHEAEAVMLIAQDIRTRLLLRKEIRTMFASTRFMVYTMDILPFAIMLWLLITNKSYTSYYFSGVHLIYMGIMVFFCLTGSFINHHKIYKSLKEA